MLSAFLIGAIQVALVVFQTRQIARQASVWRIVITAMLVAGSWVFCVHVAMTGIIDGISYAVGAGIGSLVAMKLQIRPA